MGFYCVPCPEPTSLLLLVKELSFLWGIHSKWFGWDCHWFSSGTCTRPCPGPITILHALGQSNWIRDGHVTQTQTISSLYRTFLPKLSGKKFYSSWVTNLVGCEPFTIGGHHAHHKESTWDRRSPDDIVDILNPALSNQTYPLDFSDTWVKIFPFCLIVWVVLLHTKPHEYKV